MINISNRIKVNGSVLCVQDLGDQLVVLDNLYNLYLLSKEKLEFIKSINVTKSHDPWHRYAKSLTASSTKYFNIALSKTSKSIVLHMDDGIKKMTSLAWHKADISYSVFSEDNRFLATGGEDGKTVIYSLPTFDMAASLFPKPDYISNVTFSSDGQMIASCAFDKSASIFDFERHEEIAEFEASDVIEAGYFFGENDHFFFVCKDGCTGVFDIKKKAIISQKRQYDDWLTCCTLTKDGRFAIVGGKSEYLHAIRLSDNTKIFSIPVEHVGVTGIRFFGKKKLFVSYIDGTIEVIDFFRFSDEVDVHLKVNDFYKAKDVSEKNIFLKLYPPYIDKKDEEWAGVLKAAIDLLATNKVDEAMHKVDAFIDDPARNEEFSFYMSQRETIAAFLEAVEANDIPEAYKAAEKDPNVKKLSSYEKLEKYWEKVFDACKKLLQKNPQLNKGKAQELLKPFLQVKSKKDLATTLLNNSEKYTEADSLLKKRDFVAYFNLAERFPFLKETEVYKKTMMIGEQLMERMGRHENDGEFQKAMEAGKLLTTLAPFRKAALERTKLIEKKVEFLEAVKAKDLQKAYFIVESSPDLKSMKEFIELNERFKILAEEAYNKAFAGEPNETLNILSDYLEIGYWEHKVGSIMNVAYLNEIKKAGGSDPKETINWVKTVETYIDRFGRNDELERVCETGRRKEALDSVSFKGDAQGYLNNSYLSTIIIRDKEE